MSRKVYVLLGVPGAGKGTQAKRLAGEFNLAHVSTGEILRSEVREGTELGKKVKEIMEAGELVPDDLVIEIIRCCLQNFPDKDGFVLDGFPRNVRQARYLETVSDAMGVIAINIDVEEEEVIRRLSGRRFCPSCGKIYHIHFSPSREAGRCDDCGARLVQRKDDREEVVSERLRVYREKTFPVLHFYSSKGNYFEVDGNRSVDEVFEGLSEIVARFEDDCL